jgi:hypothetical protein
MDGRRRGPRRSGWLTVRPDRDVQRRRCGAKDGGGACRVPCGVRGQHPGCGPGGRADERAGSAQCAKRPGSAQCAKRAGSAQCAEREQRYRQQGGAAPAGPA